VYVFRKLIPNWAQEAFIKPSSLGLNEQFGFAVALDGDTLAVGTPFEDSNATGIGGDQANNAATESGAVFVFKRNGGAWSQEAYVKASNTDGQDLFGTDVGVSGDLLVVAAPGEDSGATGVDGNQSDNGALGSGAAYILQRTGSTWSHEHYLKASNTDGSDGFGSCVAIRRGVVAVGSLYEDSASTGVNGSETDDTAMGAGATYVFREGGNTWAQDGYVKASNTDATDEFGCSIALTEDTLAIGAAGEASSATGLDGNQQDDGAAGSGAVYVFR
jgi:hypothetical protein